jgi:S1-C subfamily serine protease
MWKRNSPQLLVTILFLTSATTIYAQDNLPELVKRVKPSVVAIVTYDAKGEPLASGSGFFVRAQQVVTNLHVIRNAYRAEIKTLDGKGKTYLVAGVLDVDEEGDLALLSIGIPSDRERSVGLSARLPEDGEKIFVIGNPLRLEGTVSDGIVSAVRELPSIGRIIQITAPISYGNSGSPVFNLKGQVVGVVTVRVMNGQNINLAMGSSRVADLRPGKIRGLAELASNQTAKDKPEALAESLYRSGLDSMLLGNYESALGYFENAASKNPKRAEAWIQVGYCRVKQGRSEEAIKAYEQALQLRPDSADVYNKLGDAYYYAKKFNEAIMAYKRAVELYPDMAEAYYNLGLTYMEVGDRSMALAQSHTLQQLDEKLYEKLLSEMAR